MADDLELLQLLFDTEPAANALGFPVNAAAFVKAVRAIRERAVSGEPEKIAAAWNELAGALGPKLTAALLSGEEWRWICPPTLPLDEYDSDDLSQAVWVGSGHKVIARATMDGEHLIGLRFAAEAR
jgi:hypothetical protein